MKPTIRSRSPRRTRHHAGRVRVGGPGQLPHPGIASIAQQRKIQLRSVQAVVEADHDLHGILGADSQIRNGFTGVRVSYQIDADATAEQVKALVAQ